MDQTTSKDELDQMSGEGYERDDSRMAEEQSASSREQGKNKRKAQQSMMPIAHKRRARDPLTDSGYEQDVSSDMAVIAYGSGYQVGKSDREEETQVLPYSLGNYIDHSLDPDSDDRPFAPIHRKPNFVESLFAILSNPKLSNVIEWLPHGRSFLILDRDQFAKSILPVYYRHSNLPSFTRQLNGYGFNKIKIGPYEKSYYHPLFLRNLPHLVKSIKRCGTQKSHEGQSILNESQLDRVSAERPVPTIMSPRYEHHIKTMNRHIYEGFGLNKLKEQQSQAPHASTAPTEASYHPDIPSVIHTQKPKPLPQVVFTPPPQQQQHQQGVVFTHSHQPLAGVGQASESQHFPSPLPLQHQQQHQPVSTHASTEPQNIPAVAAQDVTTQLVLAQDEARRQAQMQLLINAMAAAAGHGQVFQPLALSSIMPQLAMDNQQIPALQFGGSQQPQQQQPGVNLQLSTNLHQDGQQQLLQQAEQQCFGYHVPQQNVPIQQGLPISMLDTSLATNPTQLNQMSQVNEMQPQRQQQYTMVTDKAKLQHQQQQEQQHQSNPSVPMQQQPQNEQPHSMFDPSQIFMNTFLANQPRPQSSPNTQQSEHSAHEQPGNPAFFFQPPQSGANRQK